jgi:hypothetical protein
MDSLSSTLTAGVPPAAAFSASADPIASFLKHVEEFTKVKDVYLKQDRNSVFCEIEDAAMRVAVVVERKQPMSTSTETLLPMVLCDIVARYVGFHEIGLRVVFETLLHCSAETRAKIWPWHHHLAVESWNSIRPVFLSWKMRSIEKKFPPLSVCLSQPKREENMDEYLLGESEEDQLGVHGARMKHGGMMRNATIHDLVIMLLYWSILYDNKELQQGLWAYLYLEPTLFRQDYWTARLMASMKMANVKLFRNLWTELQMDTRIDSQRGRFMGAKESILHQVVMHQFPCKSKEHRAFVLLLLDEGLLPSPREMVMLAMQNQDSELQALLLKNLRVAQLKALAEGKEFEGYEEEEEGKSLGLEQWQESLEFFQAGAYKEVIENYQSHNKKVKGNGLHARNVPYLPATYAPRKGNRHNCLV